MVLQTPFKLVKTGLSSQDKFIYTFNDVKNFSVIAVYDQKKSFRHCICIEHKSVFNRFRVENGHSASHAELWRTMHIMKAGMTSIEFSSYIHDIL